MVDRYRLLFFFPRKEFRIASDQVKNKQIEIVSGRGGKAGCRNMQTKKGNEKMRIKVGRCGWTC